MRQRELSIDILKFIACIAITNSHFDIVYGPLSPIATGGAIGDILFFFASGFTIFLSNREKESFFDYYKRRINRIYPTIFAWALMRGLIFNRDNTFIDVLLYGGFMYMLQGAMIGLKIKENKMPDIKSKIELPMLIICILSFFALYSFKSSIDLNFIQIFTFFPLLGIAYYTYRLCRTKGMLQLLEMPVVGKSIKIIGRLCLEIYICQMFLLHYEPFISVVSRFFPLGIILASASIFITAYLLHCVSNLWIQTFKDGNYDWRRIAKVI